MSTALRQAAKSGPWHKRRRLHQEIRRKQEAEPYYTLSTPQMKGTTCSQQTGLQFSLQSSMVLARRAPLGDVGRFISKVSMPLQLIWKPTSEGPPPGGAMGKTAGVSVCVYIVWPCETTPGPQISRPCLLSRLLIRQVDRTNRRFRHVNLVLTGRVSFLSPFVNVSFARSRLEFFPWPGQ